MTSTFRARYANGALTPLEPLDLAEGAEVTLSIEDGAAAGHSPAGVAETPATYDPRPPDGEAAGRESESLLELIDRLHREFPDDPSDNLPTDMAENYKHYLYGWPKEQAE